MQKKTREYCENSNIVWIYISITQIQLRLENFAMQLQHTIAIAIEYICIASCKEINRW